jgi:hypothetical protein
MRQNYPGRFVSSRDVPLPRLPTIRVNLCPSAVKILWIVTLGSGVLQEPRIQFLILVCIEDPMVAPG